MYIADWPVGHRKNGRQRNLNDKKGCSRRRANQYGDCTMLTFQNPNDPGTKSNFSVYDGKVVLELTLPGNGAVSSFGSFGDLGRDGVCRNDDRKTDFRCGLWRKNVLF